MMPYEDWIELTNLATGRAFGIRKSVIISFDHSKPVAIKDMNGITTQIKESLTEFLILMGIK